jgi:hypothetical protein
MNKVKEFLIKIVTSHSGISSKRVCGVLGWLVCMGIFIYCSITCKQAPTMIDSFLLACVALLGVDSVTDIWKKNGISKSNTTSTEG